MERTPTVEESPRLNSDQIRARFGSYGVDVIRQAGDSRLANLYSEHDGQRVCRTLAVTHFIAPTAPELSEAHASIRAGESIGATLRAAGWNVIKDDRIDFVAKAHGRFIALTGPSCSEGQDIAVRVYRLSAANDTQTIPYAVIAEAYHPEHIAPEAVNRTPDTPEQSHGSQGSVLAELLRELESDPRA